MGACNAKGFRAITAKAGAQGVGTIRPVGTLHIRFYCFVANQVVYFKAWFPFGSRICLDQIRYDDVK
jgi:hypothetical protein